MLHGYTRDGRPTYLDPSYPATTVAGGSKMTDRSHHGPGEQGKRSTNVTPREAATLQTYPTDFEFYGGKGSQSQQIGNAIPPLLAEALLRALWDEETAA